MLFELRQTLGQARQTWHWRRQGYGAPYPHYMKQATLLRHSPPGSVFIETGTYRGSTSRYFARRGFQVVTIEVHRPLFDRYSAGLRRLGVDARFGDSSVVLPQVLREHAGSPALSIFLDGHYSGGVTGMGARAVPVVKEFDAIASFVASHPETPFSVMVDDWRLFMPGGDPTYPPRAQLIEFAESLSVEWKLENDIFIVGSDALRVQRSLAET